MSATTKHDGQAPRTIPIFGMPDGLKATGAASANSHSYFEDDHPGLVAFPLHQVRMTQEAAIELSDLLDFLQRSLISDAERDDATPAWRSIASRAAVLSRAVLGVMGGDDPSVADLAEQVHGPSALWPSWVRIEQERGQQ